MLSNSELHHRWRSLLRSGFCQLLVAFRSIAAEHCRAGTRVAGLAAPPVSCGDIDGFVTMRLHRRSLTNVCSGRRRPRTEQVIAAL
jgi:hypothetical protein